MSVFLANSTTTSDYKDTVLGGESTPYDRGQLLVANNPASVLVFRGRDRSSITQDEYPFVTPSLVPLVRGANEYIFGVKVKDAVVGTHAQVSGYLVEPGVAGLGVGSAFLQTVSPAGSVVAPAAVVSGSLILFGGAAAPAGWVVCDGTHYNSVVDSTFAPLFAAIGILYGGTGANDFAVPDLRGRVPIGLGTNAAVATLGSSDGQPVGDRRPQHRTTDALTVSSSLAINDPQHFHTQPRIDGGPAGATTVMNSLGARIDGGPVVPNASTGITLIGSQASRAGSIGTNVGTDALDAPSFVVIQYVIAK